MNQVKLYLIVFFYLLGYCISSLTFWSKLLAPNVRAYCLEPQLVRAYWSAKEWKVFDIPKTYIGRPGKPMKDRNMSDYEFDECDHRTTELKFNKTTSKLEINVDFGNITQCELGYQYEDGHEASLASQFDLVCKHKWQLPALHGFLAILSVLLTLGYYVTWTQFDLRWTLSRQVRFPLALIAIAFELMAVFMADESFAVFIVFKSFQVFVVTLFVCTAISAYYTAFGGQFELIDRVAFVWSAAVGWTLSSLCHSLLITTLVSWKLMAMVSVCLPLVGISLLTVVITEAAKISITTDLEVTTISGQRTSSTGTANKIHIGDEFEPSTKSGVEASFVYRDCEELYSSRKGLNNLKGSRLYLKATETIMSNMLYYLVYFSMNKHDTCFRNSARVWCFSRLPLTETIALVLIMIFRYKLGHRGGKIYTMVISISSTVIIGVLAIIRTHEFSGIDVTNQLFEFVLTGSCVFAATTVSLNSGLELFERSSLKSGLVVATLSRLLYAIAPTVGTALDTPELRVTTFLVVSILTMLAVCVNSLTFRRRRINGRKRVQTLIAYTAQASD